MPWLVDQLSIVIELPKIGGSYALFLGLDEEQVIQIPRFGENEFPRGIYVYSGTAKGSGGLKARVSRHIRQNKQKHWHIDWFRPYTRVMGVYYQPTHGNEECKWSKTMSKHRDAQITLPGFGSSDCKQGCSSHLICFDYDFGVDNILSLITSDVPTTI